jgi:glycosyltransferase involved in cell wall biosynthesis
MKFSIVIPTQNRSELLSLAVRYALTQNYRDIELIVSDNSSTDEYRERNKTILEGYSQDHRLLLVHPPDLLAPPEHFEFALQYAKGDYVLYLTDKMILLPDTLVRTERVIYETNAEIVNWKDVSVPWDTFENVTTSDILAGLSSSDGIFFRMYDPINELKGKASGFTPRTNQSTESYVTGKICFGCFSKELIKRIIKYSGGLFGGVTHDYSAMIQGLCLSSACALLDSPGIVFISLPADKSLGSLTHLRSAVALSYYKSFSDSGVRLSTLFVPNLYSSQHNMVASDYVKYLGLYNRPHLFIEKYWLRSIGLDLFNKDRIWIDEVEKRSQHSKFFRFLIRRPIALLYWYCYLLSLRLPRIKVGFDARLVAFRMSILLPVYQKLVDVLPNSIASTFQTAARKIFKK